MKIDTKRSGPFVFQIGVIPENLHTHIERIEDAWQMFTASPLASVANQLQREVLVQSVFGTNTIEGASLSEEETARVLELDPARIQAEQEIRIRNIRNAYELAVRVSEDADWQFSIDYIRQVHVEVCRDLQHPDNQPGVFRDNPKHRPTVVGDALHGGVYKPPQYHGDIVELLQSLIRWNEELKSQGVHVLIRAPLVHLYFEWIHPFWDGNGRVGRVLEATILRQAGYKYAPFALAKFYLEQIHRYFTLFNSCRKSKEKGEAEFATDFVIFHLEGFLQMIKWLHMRVNSLVKLLLFEAVLREMHDNEKINQRQYAIVRSLLNRAQPLELAALRKEPWFAVLYKQLTDKTRERDMRRLFDLRLVFTDGKGRLWPNFAYSAGN